MASPGTIESKCVSSIVKRFRDMGSALSRNDVSDVVNELSELARDKAKIDKAGHTAGDYGRQLVLAARELTEREKLAQVVEKRQRAIGVIRRNDLMSRISEFGVSDARAMEYLDVGSIRGIKGSGLSLDALGATYEANTIGRLQAALRQDKVIAHVRGTMWLGKRDVAMERKVASEMSRQGGGVDAETHDRDAAKLGQIFNKSIEAMRRELNSAGAFISKLDGYVIAQTHDRFRIAKAGFDKWRDDITPKLADRTFAGVENTPEARNDFLKQVYTNLASGNHENSVRVDGGIPGFKGPANMAKRLSQSRSIHFKSGGDWFDYNELYGHGSLYEGIISQLQRHARDRATLETYGANPDALRSTVIDRLVQQAKDAGNIKAVQGLEASRRGIAQARFESAAGIHHVANPTWARNMSYVRSVMNMAHLGTSLASQFFDLGAGAAVLRHNGMNMLDAVSQRLRTVLPGGLSGSAHEMGELMGAMTDGLRGEIHAKFSPGDVPAGIPSRMQATYFKLNGQQWWQDRLSGGMSSMLAKNMAMQVEKPFDQIPRRLRTNLTRYGITAKDWDTLKKADLTNGGTSDRYLMTDEVQKHDPELARKLSVYYYDQTREGMTIPGAREAAYAQQMGDRGSFAGEGARLLLQFKSYTLSFTNKHLGRELFRDGVDFTNLAFLTAMAFPLGYLSLTAKDLIAGRSMRETDPRKAGGMNTWLDSFAQAGGAGIIGDAMFANYDGQGALALAGPAVGIAGDLLTQYGRVRDDVRQGKPISRSALGAAAGIVGNNMPLANLMGFRQALDWMVLYQATEWLSPGALQRREQKLRQRTGQTMMLAPAKAIPYGGGNRAFEGLRQ